jgi:hypothetical protein
MVVAFEQATKIEFGGREFSDSLLLLLKKKLLLDCSLLILSIMWRAYLEQESCLFMH